jgi:hypothetical protein
MLVCRANGYRTLTIAVALLLLATARVAWARRTGIEAMDCTGCHGGGAVPMVTLSASPNTPAIGQAVTLTVTVSQTNGPVAGLYLTTIDPAIMSPTPVGRFVAIEAGTSADSGGITHTMPRTGSGGVTTFKASWSSDVATGVVFFVNGMSANGDNTPRGDAPGSATLSIAVGCSGQVYYLDQDGDGYGTLDPGFTPRKACAPPQGYAALTGDCNDFDPSIHPGAPELCDHKDNNCDGKIDENVVYQAYCEDKDGDGHGVTGGAMKTDCAPSPGFGDCSGDCNDSNATVYPGAPEICDNRDNNCNTLVDEGVRGSCGVGWCRRDAIGCTTICTPGPPRAELCNLFDDDCDGVVDNGNDADLCGGPGLRCVQGRCVPGTSGTGGSGGTDSAGGSGGGATSDAGARAPESAGAGACSIAAARSSGDDASWLAALLGAGAWVRRPRRRRPSRCN